jgi:hypothetical protein
LQRIVIRVPWKKLLWSPTVIELEGIYLLVTSRYEWDDASNARRRESIKQARLRMAETAERLGDGGGGNRGGGGAGRSVGGWVTGLLKKALHRLIRLFQLQVKNVHVRFEDKFSSPSHKYAIGLLLESLEVPSEERVRALGSGQAGEASAAKEGLRRFSPFRAHSASPSPGKDTGLLKMVCVDHFAVYCNPLDSGDLGRLELGDVEKDAEIVTAMQQHLDEARRACMAEGCQGERRGSWAAAVDQTHGGSFRHNFVVYPSHMSIFIRLDEATQDAGKGPGSTFVMAALMEITELNGVLEDTFLRSVLCLWAGVIRFENSEKLRTLDRLEEFVRPDKSPLEEPRAWWRYAFAVVTLKCRESREKIDWQQILAGRADRLEYIELWKARKRELAMDSSSSSLSRAGATPQRQHSGSPAAALQRLESRLPYNVIMTFRRMAEEQLRAEGFQAESWVPSTLAGWQRLMGGGEDEDEEPVAQTAVTFKLRVNLQRSEVHLASTVLHAGPESSPFLRLSIRNVFVDADADDSAGLKKVEFALQDLEVTSREASNRAPNGDHVGWAPLLVRRQASSRGDNFFRPVTTAMNGTGSPFVRTGGARSGPLFRLTVVMNPAGSTYQARIQLEVDEVQVTLAPSAPWLESIVAFLDLPDLADNWSELELAAASRLANLRQQLDAKLEYISKTNPRFHVDLKLRGPLVIVQQADASSSPAGKGEGAGATGACLCLEFQELLVKTLEGTATALGANPQTAVPEAARTPTDSPSHREGSPLVYMGSPEAVDTGNKPSPTEQGISQDLHPIFYDHYRLQIIDIKLYFQSDATARFLQPTRFLDPMGLQADIAVSRIPVDPMGPRHRVAAETTAIRLRLSDRAVLATEQLVQSFFESTRKANRDLELIRRRLEAPHRSRRSMTRLASFLSPSGEQAASDDSLYTVSSFSSFFRGLRDGNDSAIYDDACSVLSVGSSISRSTGRSQTLSRERPSARRVLGILGEVPPDDGYSMDGYASVEEYDSEDDVSFFDPEPNLEDSMDMPGDTPARGLSASPTRSSGTCDPTLFSFATLATDTVFPVCAVPPSLPLDDSGLSAQQLGLGDGGRPLLNLSFRVPALGVIVSTTASARGLGAPAEEILASLTVTDLRVEVEQQMLAFRLVMSVDDVLAEGSLAEGAGEAVAAIREYTMLHLAGSDTTPAITTATVRPNPAVLRRSSSSTLSLGDTRRVSVESSTSLHSQMSLSLSETRAQANPPALEVDCSVTTDPNAKATGRPFTDLVAEVRLQYLQSHLEQASIVDIIRVSGHC